MEFLFPPTEPFHHEMLDVGDGHRVYVEQCGNPDGIPVVVLHGGPGGGCSPAMRRYFDPKKFHVILFDQRGCGRSEPHASVEHNTTWHLVDDIERIREHLNIATWHVFGGSWGATLALIYAQAHPDRIRHLVLRGVFLGTQSELDWFYGGGAGAFWPDAWQRFSKHIPVDEQDDFIAAYHARLFGDNLAEQIRMARAWADWENALASIDSSGMAMSSPSNYARAFARLENHYFFNNVFLDEDTAILENLDKLKTIPGIIVQGRFDMICPPISAWRLAQGWQSGRLVMVAKAGHALSESGITRELVKYLNMIQK